MSSSSQALSAPRQRLLVALALAGIILLGAALRFWQLGSLPPGIYRDEAYNGLDALRVLEGHTPLYFQDNSGREPLFIYLMALPIALLGATPLALRLVSAIVGTLTIPAVYWLARELSEPAEALVAAFLCAVTVWSVNLSRVAFRAVVMIPVLTVMLTLWLRAERQRTPRLALLAGMTYGLSWYTYLPARMAFVALGLVWLVRWLRGRAWWRGWLLFGAGALVVAAPLLGYMLTHWGTTIGRAGQVSVFNPDIHGGSALGMLAQNTWRTALGWFWRGDFIPRHNIPLRPVFQPLIAAAFALGIYLALHKRRRESGWGLPLVFLGVMCLPTILAEGAPHFLRATGVLPVLYLFPALGVAHVARVVGTRIGPARAWVLAAALLLAHGAAGAQAYHQHLHSQDLYYNTEAGATVLANDLNGFLGTPSASGSSERQDVAEAETKQAYIVPRLWENWPSVRYLCHGQAGLSLLTEGAIAEADRVLVIAWPYEDLALARAALPPNRLIRVREGAWERGDLETEARLLYVALEAAPLEETPANVSLSFERGIHLVGYEEHRLPTGEICVTLFWRCGQPLDLNYTAFVHLLDGSQRIGQHDGPTGLGYYPTDAWRPGDVVADTHLIERPPDDHGPLQIVVGLYDYQTMERLRLMADDGSLSEIDQVVLPLQP